MSSLYKLCGSSLVAVAVAFCAVSDTQAQGRARGGAQGGGGFGGFGGAGGFGGGGDLFMLQNDGVRQELGIVDEQVEKLDALQTKQREQMRELFSGMQNLSREEQRAKMEQVTEKMQKANEDIKKQMESILLPNQVKRLEQIGRQTRMRMGGQGGTNSDLIATELKLSDSQKEKLKEKATEIEKKLREKTAKLRQEAEDELMSVLTPEQRAQWKEMIGGSFEFQFGGRRGGADPNNPATRRPADGF